MQVDSPRFCDVTLSPELDALASEALETGRLIVDLIAAAVDIELYAASLHPGLADDKWFLPTALHRLHTVHTALMLSATQAIVVLPTRSPSDPYRNKDGAKQFKNPPFWGYQTATLTESRRFWLSLCHGPKKYSTRFSEQRSTLDGLRKHGFGLAGLMGSGSRMFALDFDNAGDGIKRFHLLCRKLWDQDTPPAGVMWARTQSGGHHLYFRWVADEFHRIDLNGTDLRFFPNEIPLVQCEGKKGILWKSGVDLRTSHADGTSQGVIVLPPTIGMKGQYRWASPEHDPANHGVWPAKCKKTLARYIIAAMGHHKAEDRPMRGMGAVLLKQCTAGNRQFRTTPDQLGHWLQKNEHSGLHLTYDEVCEPAVVADRGVAIAIDAECQILKGDVEQYGFKDLDGLVRDAIERYTEVLVGTTGVLNHTGLKKPTIVAIDRSSAKHHKFSLHLRVYGLRIPVDAAPKWRTRIIEACEENDRYSGTYSLTALLDEDYLLKAKTLTVPYCAKSADPKKVTKGHKKPRIGRIVLLPDNKDAPGLVRLSVSQARASGLLRKALLAPGDDEQLVPLEIGDLWDQGMAKRALLAPVYKAQVKDIDVCISHIDGGKRGKNSQWYPILAAICGAGGTVLQGQAWTQKCVDAGHPNRASEFAATWKRLTAPRGLKKKLGYPTLRRAALEDDRALAPTALPTHSIADGQVEFSKLADELIEAWFKLPDNTIIDNRPGFLHPTMPDTGTHMLIRSALGNGKTTAMLLLCIAALLLHIARGALGAPRIVYLSPRISQAHTITAELSGDARATEEVLAWVLGRLEQDAAERGCPEHAAAARQRFEEAKGCSISQLFAKLNVTPACYDSVPNKDQISTHYAMVIQVESLHHLTKPGVWQDVCGRHIVGLPMLVMIDELEGVLAQLVSPTMRSEAMLGCIEAFEYLVRSATTLVCCDGFLSQRGVAAITSILGFQPRVVWHTHVENRGEIIEVDRKDPGAILEQLTREKTAWFKAWKAANGDDDEAACKAYEQKLRQDAGQRAKGHQKEQRALVAKGERRKARAVNEGWLIDFVLTAIRNGNRVCIASGSKRFIEAATHAATELGAEARAFLGGVKSKGGMSAKAVFGPDPVTGRMPHLVGFSPCVTVGLSWNRPDPEDPESYDVILSYAVGRRSCGARDQVQQALRVRWSNKRQLLVKYVQCGAEQPVPIETLREMTECTVKTYRAIMAMLAGCDGNAIAPRPWLERLYKDCAVEREIDKRCFRSFHLHMLRMSGYGIDGAKKVAVDMPNKVERHEGETDIPHTLTGLRDMFRRLGPAEKGDHPGRLYEPYLKALEAITGTKWPDSPETTKRHDEDKACVQRYQRLLVSRKTPRAALALLGTLLAWLDPARDKASAEMLVDDAKDAAGASAKMRALVNRALLFDFLEKKCRVLRVPNQAIGADVVKGWTRVIDENPAVFAKITGRAPRTDGAQRSTPIINLLKSQLGYECSRGGHATSPLKVAL